ncbi:hypothetical protein D043_0769A, partial [Vibrio parahaemolyticus EKP-021]
MPITARKSCQLNLATI